MQKARERPAAAVMRDSYFKTVSRIPVNVRTLQNKSGDSAQLCSLARLAFNSTY